MIDVHYWPTPNGKKVTVLLEELGMPYRIVPCNIGKGDQFTKRLPEDRPQQPHAGDGRPRSRSAAASRSRSSSPARS